MPVTEAEAVAAIPKDGWVRRYVIHALKQTTAPLIYHLGMGVTLMGTTCPVAYGMHFAGALRANNFCLLVGRSGEDQKSSALGVGKEILDAAAPHLVGDFPGSPEGLVESLAEQPSQMIPISEFGKFLSSAQRGYFEPTKTLLADLWDCLDSQTEILTVDGWKGMGMVKKGDIALCLNPNTDKLVRSTISDTAVREVRPGERMVVLKGNHYDLRVTEGHRFYVKPVGAKPAYRVWTGADLLKRKAPFRLPFSASPAVLPVPIPLQEDEISTIAWETHHLGKPLPRRILRFSQNQFITLWVALCRLSGIRKPQPEQSCYHTQVKGDVDLLQQAAVQLGFSTWHKKKKLANQETHYMVAVKNYRMMSVSPNDWKSVTPHSEPSIPGEKVWCATTEHGTLITRRGGKVIILGNCLPVQRKKANNKTIRVDTPRLSIGAACSIPYLEKHTLAEDWTGGFMGRWLVFYGRRERDDPDPVGDRTDFTFLTDLLRARTGQPTGGWCVGLTSAAAQIWRDWYVDMTNRKLPDNIIGIRARAPAMARKIALVYGWDFGPAPYSQPWHMDVDILEPAIALAELHVKSLIDLSEVIAEHPDARLRRAILSAIHSKGDVATLGDLIGVLKMRKRPLTEMLEALQEEGRILRQDSSTGKVVYCLTGDFESKSGL